MAVGLILRGEAAKTWWGEGSSSGEGATPAYLVGVGGVHSVLLDVIGDVCYNHLRRVSVSLVAIFGGGRIERERGVRLKAGIGFHECLW